MTGAVTFQERTVREVMTPRKLVIALPANVGLAEALRVVSTTGHSRFPVYEGTFDNTLGFIYSRDVYEAALKGGPLDVAALLQPALVVPDTSVATEVLPDMRRGGCPLAFVVDEHGSIQGLITLEDLVEVIVGEIRDEHRSTVARTILLENGTVESDGAVPIHELNREYGLALPESSTYVTVGGLFLERSGQIPAVDDVVAAPPYTLSVMAMQGKRISRVRIASAV